jgi:hypothetical protein
MQGEYIVRYHDHIIEWRDTDHMGHRSHSLLGKGTRVTWEETEPCLSLGKRHQGHLAQTELYFSLRKRNQSHMGGNRTVFVSWEKELQSGKTKQQ